MALGTLVLDSQELPLQGQCEAQGGAGMAGWEAEAARHLLSLVLCSVRHQ